MKCTCSHCPASLACLNDAIVNYKFRCRLCSRLFTAMKGGVGADVTIVEVGGSCPLPFGGLRASFFPFAYCDECCREHGREMFTLHGTGGEN